MSYPYSIKNLRMLQTHDGHALTATLYREKLKIGTIEDTGTGGGIWPHIESRSEQDLFNDWVKSLEEVTSEARPDMPAFTYAHTSDSALDLLVSEVLAAKETARLDRAAKTKFLFRDASDGETSYHQVDTPERLRALSFQALLETYRLKAPWFATVVDVWVPGKGWTPPDRL